MPKLVRHRAVLLQGLEEYQGHSGRQAIIGFAAETPIKSLLN
jgi:hypothetical protein